MIRARSNPMPTDGRIAAPAGRSRICGLDGIRALAFLIVLGGHCGFSWIPNGFGVTVFFFLSGYLITTLLRLEWIQTADISIPRFYIRRAFRMLPPFYCALIFAIVLASAGLTPVSVRWRAIAVVQLFLTNYGECIIGVTLPAGLSVLWSLAVEEHFYFIFPFIYRSLLRRNMHRNPQLMMFGGLCVLVLAWRAVLMFPLHADWTRVYLGTDTRIDSILYGSIMAIALNPVIDNLDRLSRGLCTVAAIAGALILIASIAVRGEMFRQTVRYTIQGIALLPVFLFVIRYPDSLITRLLDLKVFTHIGDLSYSLYLVHATILVVVEGWVKPRPVVNLILTFTLSYVLALVIRQYVELPSHRMRGRVLRKLETTRMVPAVLSPS